jgi:hypothetical protein
MLQNDRLNISFVKDTNVACKKMTKNGHKMTKNGHKMAKIIVESDILRIRLYIWWIFMCTKIVYLVCYFAYCKIEDNHQHFWPLELHIKMTTSHVSEVIFPSYLTVLVCIFIEGSPSRSRVFQILSIQKTILCKK